MKLTEWPIDFLIKTFKTGHTTVLHSRWKQCDVECKITEQTRTRIHAFRASQVCTFPRFAPCEFALSISVFFHEMTVLKHSR